MSPNVSRDAEELGNRVGKYQLQGEIGQGRMGTVYVAYDPTLDRKVAVKILAPHLVCEPPFVDGFRRELRSAAQLDHPNIVMLHDAGRKEGRCYYVMNYVEGQPLAELIRERAPLSADETLSMLRPLAEALDYAHCRGMLHGDIKPANVIVGAEGRVTLTDFAIARAVEGTWLTRWGVVVGTPEYMSPEQAMGKPIDARSDQYSLGVLAYEMLTGHVPFSADSNVQLVHKVVYEAPPPLEEARPDLAAAGVAAVERVLAKDPADRYADCGEFVSALAEGLGLAVEKEVVYVPAPAAPGPAEVFEEEPAVAPRLGAPAMAPIDKAERPAGEETVATVEFEGPDAAEGAPPEQAEEPAGEPMRQLELARAPAEADTAAVPSYPEVEPAGSVEAEPAPEEAPSTAPEWQEEETEAVRAAKVAATEDVSEGAPDAAREPLGIPSVKDEPKRRRRSRRERRAATTPVIPSLEEEEAGVRRGPPVWARVLLGLIAFVVLIGVAAYLAYYFGVLPAPLLPYAYAILPPRVISYEDYVAAGSAQGDFTPTPAPSPTPTLTPIPSPTSPAEAVPLPVDAAAGDVWTRPTDAMAMVFVPAGEFMMGSDSGDGDEQPVHAVSVSQFWIDETEVTNTQYRWCVEAGACSPPTMCDFGAAPYEDVTRQNHPVVCVDWAGARAYCEWVGGRLPTEAEWEYAARGPAASTYPWGDLEPSCGLAHYAACGEGTVEVGTLTEGASWVGALDMAGNVWEWTGDWYDRTYYAESPGQDPTGPDAGSDRVLRGGGWYFDERYMRAAGRYKLPPAQRLDYVGFRCVYTP